MIYIKIKQEKGKMVLDWTTSKEVKCYNIQLGSGCNLGKYLSREQEDNQLVKCKNTGWYLQLYIPKDHKTYIHQQQENELGNMRMPLIVHEALTDPIHC